MKVDPSAQSQAQAQAQAQTQPARAPLVPAAAQAPAPEPSVQPRTSLERDNFVPAAASQANTHARPSMLQVPLAAQVLGVDRAPSYAEMMEQLEPMIQQQQAEIQAILDAQGTKPSDVRFLYAPDISGDEIQVCVACGVIGHGYRPVTVRQENAEINMLSESLVLFLEVAHRLGVQYGVVVFDDKGVLPLADVKAGQSAANRALMVQRFDAFRHRNDPQVRDVKDRSWMAQAMSTWQAEWANRKMAGEPLDEAALRIGTKLLASALGTPAASSMIVVKSQVPKNGMRAWPVTLKKGKPPIKLVTVAVGKKADEVKKAFGGDVMMAANMHELRGQLGAGMKAAVTRAVN